MTILRTYHHPIHSSTWLSTGIGSRASTRLSNLWITDGSGQAIQHLHYLPFGEDWVDQRNSSWNAPYTFSGKEKDVETGYGYFGARYYDSALSIWLSVDPMSDKYPSMSPYNYCANNPVVLVDPDGREVVTHDEASQTNIINTLTKEEAKYVRFNKDGTLDKKRLNKCKSTSENFTALKELANSERKYNFKVTDKDSDGEEFGPITGNNVKGSYDGVCEYPGALRDPSPDNDVWILVGDHLSEGDAAETTAHEAYGHGYFYELKMQGNNVTIEHTSSFDTYTTENGETGFKLVKTNLKLENQIKKVTNQARENYQSRKKR